MVVCLCGVVIPVTSLYSSRSFPDLIARARFKTGVACLGARVFGCMQEAPLELGMVNDSAVSLCVTEKEIFPVLVPVRQHGYQSLDIRLS